MKHNRIALGVLLAAAGVAQAEVTFTPSATWTAPDSRKNADNELGYNLSLGYRFTPAFGVELVHGRTESKLHGSSKHLPVFNGTSTTDSRTGLDAYYAFMADQKFSPYVLLGAGEARYKTDAPGVKPVTGQPNSTENYSDPYVNGGVGAFYRFNQSVALRGEYRVVFNGDETLFDNMALVGLEFSGAAAAAAVAAPQPEPEQAPVEEQAAPAPAPVDTDSDGVADNADKCASTPAGVQVDANGCPLDGDKDGVADYLDKCANTAELVVVDDSGCAKTLTEAISMELKVQFDSGKAVVKDEFKAEIEKAAAIMKQYPTAHMEIQGHTDSSGRAAANNALSQQRADAVRAVLVNEMGVKGDNITAKGYGSSQPVANNKTAEGRAQNRRVVAVVTGEAKKVLKKTSTKK